MNNNQQGLYGSSHAPGNEALSPAQLPTKAYEDNSIDASKQEERERIEGIPGDLKKTNELLNQEMLRLKDENEKLKTRLSSKSTGGHHATPQGDVPKTQNHASASKQHEVSEMQNSSRHAQIQDTKQVPEPPPQGMPSDQALRAIDAISHGTLAALHEAQEGTRLEEIEQLVEQLESDSLRFAVLEYVLQARRELETSELDVKGALDFNKQVIDLFLKR